MYIGITSMRETTINSETSIKKVLIPLISASSSSSSDETVYEGNKTYTNQVKQYLLCKDSHLTILIFKVSTASWVALHGLLRSELDVLPTLSMWSEPIDRFAYLSVCLQEIMGMEMEMEIFATSYSSNELASRTRWKEDELYERLHACIHT